LVTAFDCVDYFTDQSLVSDPYPYFEHLRGLGPVVPLPAHGVVAVTGYDEALAVFRETDTFSSCNSVTGPFPGLPFTPEGDDIVEQVEQHRRRMPMGEYVVTQDPPAHTAQRGLLMRLLTPKRMRENEAFMWDLADRQIDTFIERGAFEVLEDYAHPFALLVIADLLGVPEDDRSAFRDELLELQAQLGVGMGQRARRDPLAFLTETFTAYIEDRRRAPRQDVLTHLATATYPDGSTPPTEVVVRTATFLFAAGQDTTTRLLASGLRILAEQPDLQELLRCERDRIPNFIEEVLRVESPVKGDFRLARQATTLAGVPIPAGTTVMVLLGAANRDPDVFERPHEVRPDRGNAQAHLSFGRGIHSCPGGPLSRIEVRVSFDRLLDRLGEIRLAESHHGPPDARRFDFEPTYILRGLSSLHLEFNAGNGGTYL
jgi:cytochrome P450